MALMALFFLYLSNKLSVKSPDNLSHLSGYKNSQPGSQRSGQIGCTRWLHVYGSVSVLYDDPSVVFMLRCFVSYGTKWNKKAVQMQSSMLKWYNDASVQSTKSSQVTTIGF